MEFEIDIDAVQAITSQEYAQASSEIADAGILEAYRRSCLRHDERLAHAADAGTLACKAGCYWCCYFSVDVRPVEVLNIVDFMTTQFTLDEQARLRKEIEANSAILSRLSETDRVQQNIKCPFLSAGRCTIYSARPQTCRNYHATNATGCQKSFEEPNNLDIDPDFAPLVYQIGSAHVDAFAKAMGDAGYDSAAYELNSALAAALVDPELVRQRFADHAQPFPHLQGTEVPPQFLDLDDQ
jgi:Fe-S-cluster containining protein